MLMHFCLMGMANCKLASYYLNFLLHVQVIFYPTEAMHTSNDFTEVYLTYSYCMGITNILPKPYICIDTIFFGVVQALEMCKNNLVADV